MLAILLVCTGLASGAVEATTEPGEPLVLDPAGGRGGLSTQDCGNGPADRLVCFVFELLPNFPMGGGP